MEKDSTEKDDKKENKIEKKEESKGSNDQPLESAPIKSSAHLSQTLLTILKYTLVSSIVFVVLGMLVQDKCLIRSTTL